MPDELRCSGNTVQQCDASGSLWADKETCTTYCAAGTCALDGLNVTADQPLDGTVYVKGAVVVRAGTTLSVPKGDLTLVADSITVEQGASISAAAVGMDPQWQGAAGTCRTYPHGWDARVDVECLGGKGGTPAGSDSDSFVAPGGPGGIGGAYVAPGGSRAPGGGAIRLVARTIAIAGQVTANGAAGDSTACNAGGGGGAGGGILAAADDLTVSGAISAVGGVSGKGTNCSGVGRRGLAGPPNQAFLDGSNFSGARNMRLPARSSERRLKV